MLVIDTGYQRHRFSALPGVRGGEPGLWQLGFVIPASLAPFLSGRLTLALGSVTILLPPPIADSEEFPARVTDGESHSDGSERAELEHAHREAERLRADVASADGRRCKAEQLAHSEAALRNEIERDQAVWSERLEAHARAVLELLEDVQLRARQLKRDVEVLRRASDEAFPPLTAAAGVDDPSIGALRRELEQERSARTRLEAELDKDRERAAYVTDAIEDIGHQLDTLRVAAAAPPSVPDAVVAMRQPASRRGGEQARHPLAPTGEVTPDQLAAALYRLREATPPLEAEPDGVAGDPDLSAASATGPAAPAPATAPWLRPAMRRVLSDDPTIAGKIALHLLPAQTLVAGPVRYDLVIGPTCLTVTLANDRVAVEVVAEPRPLSDVDFRIEGDLAGLGRLLVCGALRRRCSRQVARVRGNRRALRTLKALLREPLTLRELHAAGVQLDPELAFHLIAGMIEPSWTVGERFTLGHETRGGDRREYLLVRDGARPCVSRHPPLGPVASTILCPDEQLFPLLAGGSAPEGTVLGRAEPVAQLREWIARAERAA